MDARNIKIATAGLCFLLALFFMGAIAIQETKALIGISVSLIPLILFCYLFSLTSFRSSKTNVVMIGPIILVIYFIFFILRGSAILLSQSQNLLISVRGGPAAVLTGVGIAMCFYVSGYYVLMGKNPAVSIPNPPVLKNEGSRVFILAVLFIALAYLGQVLLLYEYRSLAGLREQYILHTKTFNQSTVEKMGLMLWSTFHPFGVWLATLAFAYTKNRHKRIVYGAFLFFVLTVAVTTNILIFGSRLQLLVVGAGVLLIYHWKIKNISRRDLVFAAPALIIFSVWIVAYRTNNIAELGLESVISNLGHSVLDTLIAVHNYPLPSNFVTSPERWLQLPVSLIPRVIWPDKPSLAAIRLDWLIADYFRGYTGRSTTGYPSSMFAEWYILGGWPLVTLLSFVVGLFTGFIDQWFLRNRDNRYIIVIYASLLVSMVNYFKDGDMVMSTSSTLKSLTIALLIYKVLQWNYSLSSNQAPDFNPNTRSPIRRISL